MPFLPAGYEHPKSMGGSENYLNPSKIEDGDSVRFRILSDAFTGWEYWTADKQPVRSKTPFEGLPADIRLDPVTQKPDRIKFFWAFAVYNYDSEKVQVCQVTQKMIQNAIMELYQDWGEPSGYDLRLKRKGEKLNTEYSVIPIAPAPFELPAAIAYAAKINFEALYYDGDLFEHAGEYAPNAPQQQTYAAPVATATPPATAHDFGDLMAKSSVEIKRLGWDAEYGKSFLLHNYQVNSRQLLNEQQLVSFVDYLKAQPTPAPVVAAVEEPRLPEPAQVVNADQAKADLGLAEASGFASAQSRNEPNLNNVPF